MYVWCNMHVVTGAHRCTSATLPITPLSTVSTVSTVTSVRSVGGDGEATGDISTAA